MKEKYIEESNEWEISLDPNDPEDKEIFKLFKEYCKRNGVAETEKNLQLLVETALKDAVERNK